MSRLFVALLALVPTALLAHPRTDMLGASPRAAVQPAAHCTYAAGLAEGGLSGRMPTMVSRCVVAHDVSLSLQARNIGRSARRPDHDRG